MTCFDKHYEEIERDPARLRACYWHMTMHWKRLAARYRYNSRRGHVDGADLVRRAAVLERCAEIIADHIDVFVDSTSKTQG